MVKRLKVGLIYSYNQDWVAGAYYILNLVHAINQQEDKNKPELIILSYSQEDFDTLKNTGYPYLTFHQLNKNAFLPSYTILERGLNKFFRSLSGKNLIIKKNTKKRLDIQLDILFPATMHSYFSSIKNRVFWIPDFQEHFLPHFFSEQEIASRSIHQQNISDNAHPIVFSSTNALNHYKKLYPKSASKTFVLPFAVTHPAYNHIPIESLLSKHLIDRPYFFCPNQVWKHKNHITVLKAVKRLKDQGKEVLVVFSGKEYDNRNPDFFNELKKYIAENNLAENIKFLGFIDRTEQLQLMNNAICILQPSLFEGWSTVIEDAKAMGQYVIASNLPVHLEQIKENVLFFDPENDKQLGEYLSNFTGTSQQKTKINYPDYIAKFGEQFIKITNEIARS